MTPEELADEEALAQYGRENSDEPCIDPRFRCVPRFEDGERDVSLLRGQMTIHEAAQAVCRRPAKPGDVVRHTTAGALRSAGFLVSHTPTKRNKEHVSVEHQGKWTENMRKAFDLAFDEARGLEESADE